MSIPTVVYEDDWVLAVDKPAGCSVGAKGPRSVAATDLGATVQERWGLGAGSGAIEPVESNGLRERYAELRELGR